MRIQPLQTTIERAPQLCRLVRSGIRARQYNARTPVYAMSDAVKNAVKKADEEGRPRIAVVALGGNALLQRDQPLTMANQQANARTAAQALSELVEEEGLALCVTHGNGPQVGLLAEKFPETSLDVLGAESEGQIGYLVELELGSALRHGQEVAALLTKTVVDPEDPAFQDPTKFIGPMYKKEDYERLQREKGWAMKPDGDKGYRRVVASPAPISIQEASTIRLLLRNNVCTVCCGGGGVPVALDKQGGSGAGGGGGTTSRWRGVEAVVDKDAASALLGKEIQADVLLLLTDADAIYDPSKWPEEKVPLPSPISVGELERLTESFANGSMRPKVRAAIDFVRATGGVAGIGSLQDALGIVQGAKGTLVTPGGDRESDRTLRQPLEVTVA